MRTLLLVILFCMVCSPVYAELSITEIYPAPSSGEPEWVELYNDQDAVLNLQDYTLTDAKNNLLFFGAQTVEPKTTTLATSSGVLNNDGDTVTLKHNSQTIDSITYKDTFTSTRSYTKCTETNEWIVTTIITKNSSNAQACVPPTATSIPPSPTINPTDTPSPLINSVYISEVLASPEDGEAEWVELYNDSDDTVSLHNWQIDDAENQGASPKPFSLIIQPRQYAAYELSSVMFNNDGDIVRLLDDKGNLKEALPLPSSQKGLSLGKTSIHDSTICMQNPTRSLSNSICISPTSKQITPTPTLSPTLIPMLKTSPLLVSSIRTPTPSVFKISTLSQLPVHHTHEASYSAYVFPTIHETPKGAVLGVQTIIQNPPQHAYFIYIPLSSSGICVLTICSILFKIKKGN